MKELPGSIYIALRPDKKMLLQQRSDDSPRYPGYWCFPGGMSEEGRAIEFRQWWNER